MDKIILTPQQMKNAEQKSVALGVGLDQLMSNAGEALGRIVLNEAQKKMARHIVILTGSGNNGGDGFVCADFLNKSGVCVTVILICGIPKTNLAKAAFDKLNTKSIKIIDKNAQDFEQIITNADIIVDCVFGTGFHGNIKDEMLPFFEKAAKSSAYKIACDCPSGVNCNNGLASKGTIKCHKTVTFHRSKTGINLHPAKELCGETIVVPIGIPNGWNDEMTFLTYKLEKEDIIKFLPPRSRNSHKGSFGKLMLICGSEKYMGAAAICGNAALRSGVGIVELCTPKSVSQALVGIMPECVFVPLKSDAQGFISPDDYSELASHADGCSAIVIGCGLGVTKSTRNLVYEIIKNAPCPIIIDADGINCLSEHIDILEEKRAEIIITPHPGELSRLCGVSISEALNQRQSLAINLAEKYGVTVHAKGTQTITATPDSTCFITDFGNTALSKGGSGDMLAGLIGSFIAQGISSYKSCLLASCVMGKTAELLAETSSERSILARDIINALPKTLKFLEQ